MKIENYNPGTPLPSTAEETWYGTHVRLYKDVNDNYSLFVVETNLFDRIWAAVKWLFCCCSDYDSLLTDRQVSLLTPEESKVLQTSAQKTDQTGNAILKTQASAPPAEVTEELSPAHSVPLSLLSLPGDILRLIFTSDDYLDEYSKTVCRSTCKKLRDLIAQSPFTKTFCTEVARTGNLSLLKWARANGAPWDSITCAAAAAEGHLEVLQWARTDTAPWWKQAERAPWDWHTYRAAAIGGHLDLLKWSYENGLDLESGIILCGTAARARHPEIIQWAHSIGLKDHHFYIPHDIAEMGDLNALKWMHSNGVNVLNECISCAAAKRGDLPMLQWLQTKGAQFTTSTCADAASGGHLDVLQWLRAQGCPWDNRTCSYAVMWRHFAILQWARENNAPWGQDICSIAAAYGNLEMLQWIHARGESLDARVCCAAASNGHLDILQWARDNGAPWDRRTCDEAIRWGHLDFLQWAHANGAPLNLRTTDDVYTGNLQVLQWLRSKEIAWGQKTCELAALSGHLDIVKWASANGAPFDVQKCIKSAERGRQEMESSILANYPWKLTEARSASKRHREVLAWLRAQV